jgi:acetyl esterase/lipase
MRSASPSLAALARSLASDRKRAPRSIAELATSTPQAEALAKQSMETETYRPARLIVLGDDASPELRRATSLDALVTDSSPPFFLWHTAEDAYVPPEHTYRLAASLAAHRVPHAVHVFAHGPHSLGLAEGSGDAAAWTRLAASWLSEQTSAPSVLHDGWDSVTIPLGAARALNERARAPHPIDAPMNDGTAMLEGRRRD